MILIDWSNIDDLGFIWNGEYSDPEIMYLGVKFNARDIEDFIENDIQEGIKNGTFNSNTNFESWVEDKHNQEILKQKLKNQILSEYDSINLKEFLEEIVKYLCEFTNVEESYSRDWLIENLQKYFKDERSINRLIKFFTSRFYARFKRIAHQLTIVNAINNLT